MALKGESAELAAVFDYVRLKGWDKFIWHTVNEGERNPRTGARLKRQGMLPGVSDIIIAKASRGFHAAFIELKSMQANGRYGRATEKQKAFLKLMNDHGYFATVANGLDHCIEIMDWYLS
jgi:hypothetical protein